MSVAARTTNLPRFFRIMEDDEFLPLSGLQHLLFCERQCALIHVEQIWAENALTTQGELLHERSTCPRWSSAPGCASSARYHCAPIACV